MYTLKIQRRVRVHGYHTLKYKEKGITKKNTKKKTDTGKKLAHTNITEKKTGRKMLVKMLCSHDSPTTTSKAKPNGPEANVNKA